MGGKVAIIGGGLAGCACAYVLKQNNFEPVIFEASNDLAAGASGNPVALYNTRFIAEKSLEASFYSEGFLSISQLFSELGAEIEHLPHGSMHVISNDAKMARFKKMQTAWNWPESQMRIVSAREASDISHIEMPHAALFLPTSGTVSPGKLCRVYSLSCEVRMNMRVESLQKSPNSWRVNDEEFDIVILACGAGIEHFAETSWLPLYTVRGQIAQFAQTEYTKNLKTNINYGGYISPAINGVHNCGSTFQKWLKHTEVLEEDNEHILNILKTEIPSLSELFHCKFARASLRVSTQDRIPVIGRVTTPSRFENNQPDFQDLYISAAHGSHGVITSYMAARMILSDILGENMFSFSKYFKMDRFPKRAAKKEGSLFVRT